MFVNVLKQPVTLGCQDPEQCLPLLENQVIGHRQAGLTAPAVSDVLKASGIETARARSILQILLREGILTRVTEELVLHSPALVALRESLAKKKGQRFSVPEFKEWTGVSRKYAIPLLEHLDREHVTSRQGDERVIL